MDRSDLNLEAGEIILGITQIDNHEHIRIFEREFKTFKEAFDYAESSENEKSGDNVCVSLYIAKQIY